MHEFTLQFDGNDADHHQLDFYDAAQALLGFQRSLAITTHLVLNGQVIIQAPSLKNARITIEPPEDGSWKITAAVSLVLGGLYSATTAPRDTVLGHLVHSAYDYVVSEALGFSVDYNQSLGQQYEKLRELEGDNSLPINKQSMFDSAIEKCEKALKEMHRPIIKSTSAKSANISFRSNKIHKQIQAKLNTNSFEHLNTSIKDEDAIRLQGRVSSYNINTHRGRIFVLEEKRPISFELMNDIKIYSVSKKIAASLNNNAIDKKNANGLIDFEAYKITSNSGRVKKYLIKSVD